MEKPEENMKAYFEYLEALRTTGVTNMFGAAPYLMEMFDLSQKESKRVLMEWMKSYGKK